jgi:hypothetical protein
MRYAGLLLVAAVVGCEDRDLDPDWFAQAAWDDGKAVVSVFEGRWMQYGHWRDAEIRDYVIREFFDPDELTKRDAETELRVIKANRQVTFSTGTYDYRLMSSLFFDRATARLVKGVGTSQEGCGIAFLRWDHTTRALQFDTYWEGEGAGRRPLEKKGLVFFEDELPFVAARLADGVKITIYPSLTSNNLHGWKARELVVKRDGRRVVLGDGWAEFRYDADGFVESWTIADRQEFKRTVKRRLYYWQHTDPGDERLLK